MNHQRAALPHRSEPARAGIELRPLRSFLVLCDELHFGHAAASLGISQPALSHQIALLERHLGCLLVDRRTHRLRPTEAGLHLRDSARRVIEQVDRLEAEMLAYNAIPQGHVRIAYAGPLGSRVCPPLLRELRLEIPDVNPILHWCAPLDQLHQIIAGEFELGFIRRWQNTEIPHVEMLRLFVEPAVALVPADDPLAARTSLSCVDIRARPLIAPPPSVNPDIYQVITSWVGAAPQRIAVGSVGQSDMVAAGMGIAIGFRSVLPEREGVVVVPLAPDPPVSTVVALWRTPITAPLVEAMVAILRRLVERGAFGLADA